MQIERIAKQALSKKYVVLAGWIIMACLVTAHRIDHLAYNNFLLFKYSYFHALHGQNLYANYPECCFDSHHYGPFFSLLIAPFALMPLIPALYTWQICVVLLLFTAINQLPLDDVKKTLICLICTQELYVSLREFQTNAGIAGIIILTWVCIENRKDFWAALFIMIGFYIKIYGVVGLAFFFFSRNKTGFIQSLLFWALVLFLAPMLIFSPAFILQSYSDWFHILIFKNGQNVVISNPFQDVSVMGMIRKVSGNGEIPTFPILLAGVILFLLPYRRVDRFKERSFRLSLLASVLLFTILFSTGSELATYSIAFAGIGIWFVADEHPSTGKWLLVLAVLYFGSLFDTDLTTYHFRAKIMKPYALKALPSLIIWLAILRDMLNKPNTDTASKKGSFITRQKYFTSRLFNYER